MRSSGDDRDGPPSDRPRIVEPEEKQIQPALNPNRVLPFISINKMQTKLGLFNHIYFLITFFIFIAEEQCCKKVVCEQIKIQIQIPMLLIELAFEDISKNPALNGPERCGGGCVPR